MHPQLQAIADEYRDAQKRLRELARAIPAERWGRRSDPNRWSVAECVAHLNLTSNAYLPPLGEALERARGLQVPAPPRYRRDPVGWLLWSIMGPPVRVRTQTIARFLPSSVAPPSVLIEEFDRLQAAQLKCLAEADALPLTRVRVTSPFNARVRYNLNACFTILPRHQHRHLWQAEQVWAQL
ncbi:MAG TPA: DinB family protein [Gemmatimonadales bacterium]|nr:DinB family protein [Gemmatimonadales bacterium]